jgi:hypothetical protein
VKEEFVESPLDHIHFISIEMFRNIQSFIPKLKLSLCPSLTPTFEMEQDDWIGIRAGRVSADKHQTPRFATQHFYKYKS